MERRGSRGGSNLVGEIGDRGVDLGLGGGQPLGTGLGPHVHAVRGDDAHILQTQEAEDMAEIRCIDA